MARQRMVTRTVILTKMEVMCLDTTTAEVSINSYEISGTFSDTTVALKQVKKLYETDTFKCVAIQNMTDEEVLYGMSEVDFIQMAKVLPPRGTNAIEEAD